jgi:hypothetical protein
MAGKKSAEPSPESIARANRQRLAAEEGARARADVEQKAIAVRKNMERLRALREAREAEEARTHVALPVAAKKKRKSGASRIAPTFESSFGQCVRFGESQGGTLN